MTDDIWQELLRSPLDPEPRDRDQRARASPWLPALGVLIGVTLAGLWLSINPDADVAVGEPTTTTIASPEDSAPGSTSLPEDYVEIALDGEPVAAAFGLRPEVAYMRGEDLYVTLSSAVRAELDPESVPVFAGGDWRLESDGDAVSFSGEITNPLSLGLVTVRFESVADRTGEEAVLNLRPVVDMDSVDVGEAFSVNGLPVSIDDPLVVELEDGVVFLVDRLELGAEAGTLVWHLDALPAVRARVDAVVEFPETIGEGNGQTALVVEHWADPYPFQRPPKPPPTPSWGGSEVLRRVGPDLEDPAAITRADLLVTVTWHRASSSRVITIPLTIGTG